MSKLSLVQWGLSLSGGRISNEEWAWSEESEVELKRWVDHRKDGDQHERNTALYDWTGRTISECQCANRIYGARERCPALWGWYKPVHLKRAINAIRRKTAAQIWVFGNYIQLKQDLPNLIFQHPHDLSLKEWFGDQTYIYEASLRNLNHKLGFFFISKKGLLCPDSE